MRLSTLKSTDDTFSFQYIYSAEIWYYISSEYFAPVPLSIWLKNVYLYLQAHSLSRPVLLESGDIWVPLLGKKEEFCQPRVRLQVSATHLLFHTYGKYHVMPSQRELEQGGSCPDWEDGLGKTLLQLSVLHLEIFPAWGGMNLSGWRRKVYPLSVSPSSFSNPNCFHGRASCSLCQRKQGIFPPRGHSPLNIKSLQQTMELKQLCK